MYVQLEISVQSQSVCHFPMPLRPKCRSYHVWMCSQVELLEGTVLRNRLQGKYVHTRKHFSLKCCSEEVRLCSKHSSIAVIISATGCRQSVVMYSNTHPPRDGRVGRKEMEFCGPTHLRITQYCLPKFDKDDNFQRFRVEMSTTLPL